LTETLATGRTTVMLSSVWSILLFVALRSVYEPVYLIFYQNNIILCVVGVKCRHYMQPSIPFSGDLGFDTKLDSRIL